MWQAKLIAVGEERHSEVVLQVNGTGKENARQQEEMPMRLKKQAIKEFN